MMNDKRYDFDFRIVNVSQPIRYTKACSSHGDFIDRGCYSLKLLLIKVIRLQKLRSTFESFMVDTIIES